MTMLPREKALDKIRKLIALSGSSNVHEAQVAAAAAQRLMLEHKIAESDITIDSTEEDVVMDQEIYRDLRMKAPPRWHGILLNGVATANFCRLILGTEHERSGWHIESRKIYRLIGTDADRAATRYLYEMLRGEVERMADAIGRALAYDRAERASFKLGAASAIAGRLSQEWQAFRSEMTRATNTQALAVIDKTASALTSYVDQHFPNLTYGRPATASRRTAYMQGREAGQRVDVSRGHRGLGPGQKGLHDGTGL